MAEEHSQPGSKPLTVEQIQELIHPVRELAEIWGVPLDRYLDPYLDYLLRLGPEETADANAINFSQAGLVVQGSTNILSKKVNHLYDTLLSSSSVEEDHTEKDGKKRKRKVMEWVVNDRLCPIEDPEEVDTQMKEDYEPREELTTLPKIPFCLLSSIEPSTNRSDGSQRAFLVDRVPDQEFAVIMLDTSISYRELENSALSNTQEVSLPDPPGEQLEFANRLDQRDEIEAPPAELPDPDIASGSEFAYPGGAESEDPAADSESDSDDEQPRLPKAIPVLDPNDDTLSFMNRPFKKMDVDRIKMPTSFSEAKSVKRDSCKQPFHPELFSEIFEKVKSIRKRRVREEDRDILATLPIESGRDHILADLDAYAEPPPLPDSDDDYLPEPIPPPSPVPVSVGTHDRDPRAAYSELCQEFVRMMMEMAQQRVLRPVSHQVLSDWEGKLTPKLALELRRKPFNVREVREWIVDVLQTNAGAVTFKKLTSELSDFEVSRVFLSMLMLANSGDVTLAGIRAGRENEDFVIRLVNRTVPFDPTE